MILHIQTRDAKAVIAVQGWSRRDGSRLLPKVETALSAQIRALDYPPAHHSALKGPEDAVERLILSLHNDLAPALLPALGHLL